MPVESPQSPPAANLGSDGPGSDAASRRVTAIVPSVSQAAHLSQCLHALRRTTLPAGWSLDIVIVLNGASPEVCDVARRAVGVRVVESEANRGFAGGCRLGVESSDAAWLAFLNDDVRVEPGWLLPLLETMRERPRVGAVAPRVLCADGTVQEIGSIIWRDGTTRPFGRGQAATALAWRWRRRVDYASACALLVRRAAWDAVGGFDEGYHPAYYEDVDLCLALDDVGYEVWVDPRADVVHAESSSTTSAFKQFLFARHHARLVARWAPALAARIEPPLAHDAVPGAEAAAAARLASSGRRVLVVDDRIPAHGLGSGFDRMADTLVELAASGACVRVLATEVAPVFSPVLAGAGIEVLEGPVDTTLARALAACDVAIVSRPNNAERVRRVLAEHPVPSRPQVIYDAEALYHRRIDRQAALECDSAAAVLRPQAEFWRAIEHAIPGHVDAVVCVSDEEAAFFRQRGASRVHVLTPWLRLARMTPASLAGRADVVFVAGWLAGAESPNGDALEWLATQVLPLVVAEVPWVQVRVTGTLPAPLRRFEGPNLRGVGFVPDLGALYAAARVAVAPLRFGAGVKLKTVEALQHGVPVVATTVGAEGLDEVGAAIAVHDDPHGFAAAVTARLLDVQVWRAHRRTIDAVLGAAPPTMGWNALLGSLDAGRASVGRTL